MMIFKLDGAQVQQRAETMNAREWIDSRVDRAVRLEIDIRMRNGATVRIEASGRTEQDAATEIIRVARELTGLSVVAE